MKTRFIPLKDWQAKALSEDRLSRVLVRMRPQPEYRENESVPGNYGTFFRGWNLDHPLFRPEDILKYCPYQPGTRLGLKETWGQGWFQCPGDELCEGRIRYRSSEPEWKRGIWRSPVTMPGDSGHVRFFRLVKSVRPCLVKDVTESEAKGCGVACLRWFRPIGKSEGDSANLGAKGKTWNESWDQAYFINGLVRNWTHDHPKHPFETTWVWSVELQKEE